MSAALFGQAYTFSHSSGTYADLSGTTTSLNQSLVWDDPEYTVSLPFSFPYQGKPVSTLYVGDGYVALNAGWDTIMAVYFSDLIDRGSMGTASLSPISYKVETSGATQIFKLEWKNFGFYDEMDNFSTLNWYGNAQLWLYDNGIWEVHLGPNSILQPMIVFLGENGPAIGYGDETNNYWLSGMASNPTLVKNTSTMLFPFLSSVPADGTIYTFTPLGIGIQGKTEIAGFSAGPNPVSGALRLELPAPGTIELFDLAGKKLLALNAGEAGQHMVDLSALDSGTYLVVFSTVNGERATRKIVKL
ncbi:MAG: T9SS type A sorting domain-containing protein [Bacteroidales bacterium]